MRNREIADYKQFREGLLGRLTRAVVVSTDDPLFSGRVKIWIPTFHGISLEPATETISEDVPVEEYTPTNATTLVGNLKDSKIIDSLPWANVTTFGWGPTGDPVSGTGLATFGMFAVPEVGTEVFIIFEDDDPDKPLIIGPVFHRSDLINPNKFNPIEVCPGLSVSTIKTTEELSQDYPSRVAKQFIISSADNSAIVLSDIPGESTLRFAKRISPTAQSLLPDVPGGTYEQFKVNYPNFPTFISSPYESRVDIKYSSDQYAFNVTETAVETPISPATPLPATSTSAIGYPVPGQPRVSSGAGAFGYVRQRNAGSSETYRHAGIDLAVAINTPLIAPIDCTVLYYYADSSGGNTLFIKGVDGYCHVFCHLSSIDPVIEQQLKNKQYPTVSKGQRLGLTGNTGLRTSSPHLHWECFYGGNLVETGIDARQLRHYRKIGTSSFKGVNIPEFSVIDPVNSWLAGKLASGAVLDFTPSQAISYHQITSQEGRHKIIGVEVCTVPGMESIYLRHPSGSFIGIDPDGNIKMYSVGDTVVKSLRSIMFDSVGAIITSALAVFTKVSTIIKQYASTYKNLHGKIPDSEFPRIIKTMETNRQLDLSDTVRATSKNIFFTVAKGNTPKSLDAIAKDGYLTSLAESEIPNKNYSGATYDQSIIKYHDLYFIKDPVYKAYASVVTPKLLKALMIKESNNGEASDNLFQLTDIAIQEIKPGLTYSQVVTSPDSNIEHGILYFRSRIANVLKRAKLSITTDEERLEVVKCAMLMYNVGEGLVGPIITSVSAANRALSYMEVEKQIIEKDPATVSVFTRGGEARKRIALIYVPQILHIQMKVSI